jgi:N-acetylglutamate synthase and related acetyltransferases
LTETANFTIRDATDADLPAIRALTRRSYEEFAFVMEPSAWEGLANSIEAALSSTDRRDRIVAESRGQLIGSVLLYPPAAQSYGELTGSSAIPELRLLAVAQAARRKGVAKALVEECIRRAKKMGAKELGLHTSRSMRAARHLYEKMGFIRAPERDFQPPGAEVVEGYRLVLD